MKSKMKPHIKRYLWRFVLAMGLYLLSLVLVERFVEDQGMSGMGAFALTALPGLCLASLFWIVARYIIEEEDEFVRMLNVRMVFVATGIALTAASVWGFFERYMLVDHIEAFWWPAIWCFGTSVGATYNQIVYKLWSGREA